MLQVIRWVYAGSFESYGVIDPRNRVDDVPLVEPAR